MVLISYQMLGLTEAQATAKVLISIQFAKVSSQWVVIVMVEQGLRHCLGDTADMYISGSLSTLGGRLWHSS